MSVTKAFRNGHVFFFFHDNNICRSCMPVHFRFAQAPAVGIREIYLVAQF